MPLPSDILFGYVAGRYILSVADTVDDPDRFPDPIPAAGTVTFTPTVDTRLSLVEPPTTVLPKPITCTLDVDGVLCDPTGAAGVWLVVGQYTVTFALTGAALRPFTVEVTVDDTVESPKQLTLAAPLKPAPTQVFVVNEQVYVEARAARDEAVAAAASAQSILEGSVDGGAVVGDDLVLTLVGGGTVNAGDVRGRPGDLTASSSLGSTATLDLSGVTGPATVRATLTGAATVMLPAPASSVAYSLTLVLTQDATGGRAVTWPAGVRASYGVKPVLSTAPNAVDLVHLFWDGASWWVLPAAVGGV